MQSVATKCQRSLRIVYGLPERGQFKFVRTELESVRFAQGTTEKNNKNSAVQIVHRNLKFERLPNQDVHFAI